MDNSDEGGSVIHEDDAFNEESDDNSIKECSIAPCWHIVLSSYPRFLKDFSHP
jgi:hypothetical protein